MTTLGFKVEGTPAPQGSKSMMKHKQSGKMIMLESSKAVKPWRAEVTKKAKTVVAGSAKMTGPVTVRVTFILKRPGYHYRTGKYAHLLRDDAPAAPFGTGGMDVDKLARAVLDGLTDAGVWGDDAQVTELHAAKIYADPDSIVVAYHHPGAYISAVSS